MGTKAAPPLCGLCPVTDYAADLVPIHGLFFPGKPGFVGLSNILDSEFVRRKPTKRSHREVVGAAVVGSELSGEVIQGVKTVAGIEAFLILAVTSLHFTVVARRIRPDELVADTQVGGGGLKQSRKIPLTAGESIGKFKAVIRLNAFHADSPAGIPLEQLFEKICGGIGGLLRVGGQEAQAGELINGGVLKQAEFRVGVPSR